METYADSTEPDVRESTTGSILRIEHHVIDYAAWKAAFDTDPLGRTRSGVIRYQLMRAADDPSTVMIDLEFGSTAEADEMRARLRSLWDGPASALIRDPRARVIDLVERTAAASA